MFDRYDPRTETSRDRAGLDRTRGGRGGSDRGDDADADARSFSRDVALPLGQARELVRFRDRDYALNARDLETLATIGAFRVVAADDLPGREADTPVARARYARSHLEAEGLVERVRVDGRGGHVVTLTRTGRDLLERHRASSDNGERQTFYAGVRKPRELTHDREVYRACRHLETTLAARGACARRVVLDYELKRDYQQFLQSRNRGRADSDGRPDRAADEIAAWARAQALPYEDGHVRFPDARVEIQEADGRRTHEDLEVVTRHYRGAHAARAARGGVRAYRASGHGVGRGGGGATGRGARARRGGLADEVLR
jgi:DNA-binding PadR family transcriptional regulator